MRIMNGFVRIALLAIIATVWTSCASNSSPKEDTTNQESVESQNSESAGEALLVLNNGQKWPANIETTNGVDELILKVSRFREEIARPTADDYKMLAESLDKTMDDIFDKCTMRGDAHNELHKFLVPVFGYLKTLKSDRTEDSARALDELEKHLELYHQYFV